MAHICEQREGDKDRKHGAALKRIVLYILLGVVIGIAFHYTAWFPALFGIFPPTPSKTPKPFESFWDDCEILPLVLVVIRDDGYYVGEKKLTVHDAARALKGALPPFCVRVESKDNELEQRLREAMRNIGGNENRPIWKYE